MDDEAGQIEVGLPSEVRNTAAEYETQNATSVRSSRDEGSSAGTDAVNDTGNERAEDKEPSEQEEQNPGSLGASGDPTFEDSFTSEPGKSHISETSFEFNLSTGEGPQIDSPTGHTVMFEADGKQDGCPRLDLETPQSCVSPVQEVEGKEDGTPASPLDEEEIDVEEYAQLLHQLRAEREKLNQHNRELQMKLMHYFNKKTGDDSQQEQARTVTDQEYHKDLVILADLKCHLARNTEVAQQQTDELKLQSQEKLGQLEKEWQDLMELKKDVLVKVLRGKLGKRATQAEVQHIQASERHQQDKLVKVRQENIRLKNKILKYKVIDYPKEEQDKRFQLLYSERMSESKELNEKIHMQNKELLKLNKKIINTAEVLTHVKEKFQWSLTENHAKRSRLAEMKCIVAEKRDALTRLKQACNSLRVDNLRLKERRGLLGNTVLLRDYEDKVDACDHLEEQLRQLRLA